MFLVLFLSTFFSIAADADCNVRVDLPFRFREHLPRFRGQGFQVNGFSSATISVYGVMATGNVRLGSLVVTRFVRGEPVEVGRVNAQFLQGLPSQMISRTIPIIQAACAQSQLESARELCPLEFHDIKEERNFIREAESCDIFDLVGELTRECEAAGFGFCFPEVREYVEDKSQSFSFKGTNCRVVVKGTKRYSFEELRQLRCEGLSSCYYEILSTPSLNTTYRRERLEEDLRLNQFSTQVNTNQSERSSESDTPASAAPRDGSRVRPQ